MAQWPDEKIHSLALWYIRKASGDPATWRWTRLAEPHADALALVQLQVGELTIVSFFRSEASWYLMTTRRILGCYSGQVFEVAVLDVEQDRFGNFKGYRGSEIEVMALRMANGSEVRLEYETFKASMAPIYYLMFWKRKYPILDKLEVNP